MSKQEAQGARNWYAIHTYAGYENVVLRNLRQRIDSLGMNDKIFNVIVPVEKKIKIKGGKRVEVEEKIYPGYVLVDMVVTDDSWYVVRNTPRVTGFVGAGELTRLPGNVTVHYGMIPHDTDFQPIRVQRERHPALRHTAHRHRQTLPRGESVGHKAF